MRAKRDAEAQQSHLNWIADYAVSTLKHHHPRYLNVEHELSCAFRADSPAIEKIEYFGFVLPKSTRNILSLYDGTIATGMRCFAIMRPPRPAIRWRLAFVPHRKPGSQTCAATTHVVRSDP
jgi:hypothetical protein